jgi:carbonic anhydrase
MRAHDWLKSVAVATALLIAAVLFNGPASFAEEPPSISSAAALKQLLEGNERFVAGNLHAPTPAAVVKRRAEVAKKQNPIAVVVSCSDSRVGPELVFDQDIGDIFVVRTAGEVMDTAAIGSIEYAVAHLGTPLVIVLGHEHCGAVAAAVADAKEPGHIADVLKAIQPAVKETKGQPGDAVDNAVRANALDVAEQLQSTAPILADAVKSGRLKIVGGYISLNTGKVELLEREKK